MHIFAIFKRISLLWVALSALRFLIFLSISSTLTYTIGPIFFKKMLFTPCKAEELLKGMEFQEKEKTNK